MMLIMMINRYLISLFSSCFLFHLMKIEISKKKTNRIKKREELKYLMINESLISYSNRLFSKSLKLINYVMI